METPWLVIARKLLGLDEVRGPGSNSKIDEMFRLVGHPGNTDDVAWCAAFAGACLRLGGYTSTGRLDARSYLTYGERLGEPRIGCIAVFWRKAPDSSFGHVGFYMGEHGGQILVLGGNQGDQVNISGQPRERLLGYRWPNVRQSPPTDTTLPTVDTLPIENARDPTPDAYRYPDDVVDDWSRNLPAPWQAPSATPALTLGSTGAAVQGLQSALKGLGYQLGGVDGEFGPLTRRAVLEFQDNNNLPKTGDADARTLAALANGVRAKLEPSRIGATVEDVREEGSRTIQTADATWWTGLATSILGGLGLVDQQNQFISKSLYSALKTVVAGVPAPAATPQATKALEDARISFETLLRGAKPAANINGQEFDLLRSAAEKAIKAVGTAPDAVGGGGVMNSLVDLLPALFGGSGAGPLLLMLLGGAYTLRNSSKIADLRTQDYRTGANSGR